jgi:hypothetical protein
MFYDTDWPVGEETVLVTPAQKSPVDDRPVQMDMT